MQSISRHWLLRRGHVSRIISLVTMTLLTLAVGGCAASTDGTTAPPAVSLDSSLANETLYVINASPTAIAPSGWALTALNAQTGAVRWKVPTAGMIGKPVVAQGLIYFAPQDGYVYAVDTATGQVRWKFQRTVNVSTRVGIDGYPALDGDTLYVASDGGTVYALNATNGQERWLFTLPDKTGHIYAAPAAGRGKVYVSSGGGNGVFYALDEATGKVSWQFTVVQGFDSYPLLAGDTVYAGANNPFVGSLYAFDALTGNVRWKFTSNDAVITQPAIAGSNLFVGAHDSTLYQLDTQTGKASWQATIGTPGNVAALPTGAAPTVADGIVYVSGESGIVEALDAATGALRWKQTIDGAVDSAPTVAHGAVYVTTEKGKVYAFRASDGAPAWTFHDGGLIYASAVVAP